MKHRIALPLAALAAVALLIPTFALAGHVNEPTGPIVAAGLQVGAYPGLEQNPHPCDGSVYAGDSIRIEPWVLTTSKEDASEHWSYRLHVLKPDDSPDQLVLQWDDSPVTHQNKPAHTQSKRFDVSQTNQYLLTEDPGTWEIRFRLDGMESGNVHEDTCRFTIAP